MGKDGERDTTIALLVIDSVALAFLLYILFSTLFVLIGTFDALNGISDPWAIALLFWLILLAALAQAFLWAVFLFELILVAGCVAAWIYLYRKLKRLNAGPETQQAEAQPGADMRPGLQGEHKP